MKDPFVILGLRRSATADEVKSAYRDAVKRAHPDGGGTTEAFIEVQEAYKALTSRPEDPSKKFWARWQKLPWDFDCHVGTDFAWTAPNELMGTIRVPPELLENGGTVRITLYAEPGGRNLYADVVQKTFTFAFDPSGSDRVIVQLGTRMRIIIDVEGE